FRRDWKKSPPLPDPWLDAPQFLAPPGGGPRRGQRSLSRRDARAGPSPGGTRFRPGRGHGRFSFGRARLVCPFLLRSFALSTQKAIYQILEIASDDLFEQICFWPFQSSSNFKVDC